MGRHSKLVEKTISDFCREFLEHPYLCRTEHAHHSLFFQRLYQRLDPEDQYINFEGQRVCAIQKEYPTASDLDRSRRQNWDIAVIKTAQRGAGPTASSCPVGQSEYDYLDLDSVVEFGLNEGVGHLTDDLDRMAHSDSALDSEGRFAVHLIRLSDPFSRDETGLKDPSVSLEQWLPYSGSPTISGCSCSIADGVVASLKAGSSCQATALNPSSELFHRYHRAVMPWSRVGASPAPTWFRST
jgi:hypothetical protein